MERGRSRVLGLLVAYLGLTAAVLFALDWFTASTPLGRMTIGLVNARACSDDTGACTTFSLGDMSGIGFYASLAGVLLWGTLAYTVLVTYQAIRRAMTGAANDSMSKVGYGAGVLLAAAAVAAGFVFAPQTGTVDTDAGPVGIDVTRSAAPFLMMLAHLIGIAICYYAALQATDDGEYKPIGNLPPRAPTEQPVLEAAPVKKHASSPPAGALVGAPIGDRTRSTPPGMQPITPVPAHLKKKLKFVVLSAELTRAGIDARREDGSAKLVMWRDVVGLVARRLPAELDGLTFIDIVSTAGSTLRIMPWTRLTGGDPVDGDDVTRPRAILAALCARCPEAPLDPATKRFAGGELAGQLPDVAKLAAHDGKLA